MGYYRHGRWPSASGGAGAAVVKGLAMAPQRIPAVSDDWLHADPAAAPIPVGSPAWFTWLADPAHPSFAYRTAAGSVTLRRERRGAGWYWYAYQGQGGRVGKVYAGKAEALTAERLRLVAAALTDHATPADDGEA